jgi:hypothetical protein
MSLQSTDGFPYMYAKKWRRPEDYNFQPEVKVGDKVKVLDVLDGATQEYRNRMVGEVLTVLTAGPLGIEDRETCTVTLPSGFRMEGHDSGAIHKWEVVERAEIPVTTGNPEPVDETAAVIPWSQVIANWQVALNEYACDREWCDEYEQVVRRLFGWEPEREVNLDVNVRLTRERWLSDSVDLEKVFGGDADDIEIVDARQDFEADVVITVSGYRGRTPDTDKVKNELDECDYEYDEFEVTNYSISEN